MKKLLVLLTLFSSAHSFAQENSVHISDSARSETKMNRIASSNNEAPVWQFLVGESNYQDIYGSRATGLTIGLDYNFTPLFSVGTSYTNFKSDDTSYSGSYTNNLDYLSAYAALTPIRYNIANFDISGSILAGAAHQEPSNGGSPLFYGAGLTVSVNKQIGLSLETKVSRSYSSLNTLSLVGYY